MTAPVIGLTCYRQKAAWGNWKTRAAILHTSYIDTVMAAGGRPVLIPPCDSDGGQGAGAKETIAAIDALVLVGGEDLGLNPIRDRSEMALLAEALETETPVLAICRGLQLLNVQLGGTLIEDLPSRGIDTHRPEPGQFSRVKVDSDIGTIISSVMGESFEVSCSHHQAIERPGNGLRPSARSSDGVIEAAELVDAPFVIGVQWHPEEDRDTRLFKALVSAVTAPPAIVRGTAPTKVNKAMAELRQLRTKR
jgi:putative glutamine amidotransferase